MNFKITITRVTTTEILIKAANKTEARKQVRDYGLTEAINDYKVINEDVKINLGFADIVGE